MMTIPALLDNGMGITIPGIATAAPATGLPKMSVIVRVMFLARIGLVILVAVCPLCVGVIGMGLGV